MGNNSKQIEVHVLHEIYNDVWQFHKKYLGFPNEENVIKAMLEERYCLLKKYRGIPFAQEMITIASKSLISDWKERFTQE